MPSIKILFWSNRLALAILAPFIATSAIAQTIPGKTVHVATQWLWTVSGEGNSSAYYDTPGDAYAEVLTYQAQLCANGAQVCQTFSSPGPCSPDIYYQWGQPKDYCATMTQTYGAQQWVYPNTIVAYSLQLCPQPFIGSSSVPVSAPSWAQVQALPTIYPAGYFGPGTGGTDSAYHYFLDCEQTQPDIQCPTGTCNVQGDGLLPEDSTQRQTERDFVSPTGDLSVDRSYRSDSRGFSTNFDAFITLPSSTPVGTAANGQQIPSGGQTLFPAFTGYSYDGTGYHQYRFPYLSDASSTGAVVTTDGRGFVESFSWNGTTATPTRLFNSDWLHQQSINGQTPWLLGRLSANRLETYDTNGRLLQVADISGRIRTLTYSTAAGSAVPGPGYLMQVSDQFGRTLEFSYDANGNRTTMSDPAGYVITYAYEAVPNVNPGVPCVGIGCTRLQSITYPDSFTRTYVWDETANTAPVVGVFNQLTGIVDENGIRYATFQYGGLAAISTQRGGGVWKYALGNVTADSVATVTDRDRVETRSVQR